jgi:acyl-CoA thioester hydrolase
MKTFSLTITPRSYELDALGHVNNNSISAWLEVARTNLFEEIAATEGGDGFGWLLASLHVDFLRETVYGHDVEIRIADVSLGNSSATIDCEMFQRDEKIVSGRSVMVHLDPETGRPARMPDGVRQRFAEYSAAGGS